MEAKPDATHTLVASLESEADSPTQVPTQRLAVRARPLLGLAALVAVTFMLGWHGGKGSAVHAAQTKTITKTVMLFGFPEDNVSTHLRHGADQIDGAVHSAQQALDDASGNAADRVADAQHALQNLTDAAHGHVNGHLSHAQQQLTDAQNALNSGVGDATAHINQASESLSNLHHDAQSSVDCATQCEHSNYDGDASCEGGFWDCSGKCSWMAMLTCNAACGREKLGCMRTAAGHYQTCLHDCAR